MHITELCELAGLSRHTIHKLTAQGHLPPPHGKNRWSTYGAEHVAAIRAYQALKHNNIVLKELGPFLRDEGISIVEYARQREESIRFHGLGVA